MIDRLIESIRGNPQFSQELEQLLQARLKQSLDGGEPRSEPEGHSIERLVQAAGILSLSSRSEDRKIAFQLVNAAFELYGEALGGLSDVVRLVMSRLGNFPSLDLGRQLSAQPSALPIPTQLELMGRRIQNTVSFGSREISLTDYQRILWSDLEEGRSIASSAPTSAGKSFVFQAHIADSLASGRCKCAIFMVPTRALISQVSSSFLIQLSRYSDHNVKVLTVPLLDVAKDQRVIYVMTQERVQVLLQDAEFSTDILVVDEAHLIGDSGRGVILQSVVEQLISRTKSIQVLLTLPRVQNPEFFGKIFGLPQLRVRRTDDSPVGQNIILLNVSMSVPDLVHASLWREGGSSEVLDFDVGLSLVHPDQKLVYLAWFFGAGSQNIIYGGTQSRCEKLAKLLCEIIPDQSATGNLDRRLELASFIRDHVHPKFYLAESVISGVGFHYGHIPALVRREVEAAFEDRALDFVVCTSTLLQGVNLPARNIFMHKPEKGDDQPINAVDFWNLAGRAGRLGKEFEGNVFLVEYADWKSQPLNQEQEIVVESAIQKQTAFGTGDLIRYIEQAGVAANVDPVLENTFTRLFDDLRAGKIDATLSMLSLQAEQRDAIKSALENAAISIVVPDEVLRANPSISPRRQQRLYEKLVKDVPKKGVDYYMPPHPSGEFKPTQQRLINVYRRLQVELEGDRKSEAYKRWATLSLQWMRGEGLPDLIEYAIKQDELRVRGGAGSVRPLRPRSSASIIRDVLKDVERELRFRFVKQMGCYNSILRHVLIQEGNLRAASHIPAIPLFLELGASSTSMLSFIDLGLSRISARLLQLRAANYNMDRDTALAWLRGQRLDSLELPRAVAGELATILGS